MFLKLLFTLVFLVSVHGHQLKQVIVLSRHHIRTPLTTGLDLWTPKTWPVWQGNTGDLTPKGRLLERYMGKYFSDWMIQQKVFDNNCPKHVFVYANTKQRTVESAKAFVEGAFGNCVEVYYKNITEMDPVFDPIIRNTTAEFREFVIKEIKTKLDGIDLKEAFLELDKILGFENSPFCKIEKICSFTEMKNEVVFKVNKQPSISGAFRSGCSLVDAFMMQYYNGMPTDDIGWGQIQTKTQWDNLLKILKSCYELRFEIKLLDKDVASTLLEYLTDVFMNGRNKFYLLVGHDANLYSLMSALRFKNYTLHDQFEKTPIGGMLVFQKWHDDENNNQDLLKVNYVYQSTEQIRDGAVISLQNPPLWEILEMENCPVDINGFCPWDNFISKLNDE